MKLNHESYEKAFSNITLDDRIGMELVSNAKVKRLRKKKKITSQGNFLLTDYPVGYIIKAEIPHRVTQ